MSRLKYLIDLCHVYRFLGLEFSVIIELGRLTFTEVHSVISQKTELFILEFFFILNVTT
jgi:hypothetical protein